MKAPLLSICIPTYNRAALLQECMDNILSYPNDDIELVISDNGSPDHTYKVANSFCDPRVKYFRNEVNVGYVRNFVKLLERASAQVLLFISDEDQLNLKALTKILGIIKSDSELSCIIGTGIRREGTPTNYLSDQTIRNSNEAFIHYGFTNFYMSGTIINKRYVNLTGIYTELENVDNGLLTIYPHVFVHTLCTLSKGTVHTISDPVYYEGSLNETFAEEVSGNHYTMPEARFILICRLWDITIKYCDVSETRMRMLTRLFGLFLSMLKGPLAIKASKIFSKYWKMYDEVDYNLAAITSEYYTKSIEYLCNYIDSVSLGTLKDTFSVAVKEAHEKIAYTLELAAQLKSNPNLYIFGAGAAGNNAASVLQEIKLETRLLGFLDNDHSKWGTTIKGYQVLSVAEFKEKDQCSLILIAIENKAIALKIKSQLLQESICSPIYLTSELYIDAMNV